MHVDQKYILSLQQHNSEGIAEIYRLYAHKITKMILANQGSEDEAADILQEALIDIYKLSADGKFVLTCSFEAFLVIVCKRKWISVLRSRSKYRVTNFDQLQYTLGNDEQLAGDHALLLEKEKAIMETLETIPDRCREIIKACMRASDQRKVAQDLGLTYAYLRKKKSTCMQTLAERIRKHILFVKK